MCGLAGFAGIRSPKLRERLVYSLGFNIDDRGGHAAGYVSCVESGKPIVGRKLGKSWTFSNRRPIRAP